MKNYLLNLAEATSQWLNALLGGNPNMTVSARAYVNRRRHPLPYMLINRVFFWQEDHCMDSWVSDIMFARKALFELGAPKMQATGSLNPDL